MKAYIAFGEGEDNVLNGSQSCSCKCSENVVFPENGWEGICKAAVSLELGIAQIVAYFVTRSVTDGKVGSRL